MHIRHVRAAFAVCCLVSSVLIFAPSLEAATRTFLVRKIGTADVFLGTVGSKKIRRIPDPTTAVRVAGRWWQKRVRMVNAQMFSRYVISTPIPSVVKKIVVVAPKPAVTPAPIIAPTPKSTPAPAPTSVSTPPSPASAGNSPQIAGCSIFPADSPWNQDVSEYPVHPSSTEYITAIGPTAGLHADFGGGGIWGIPFNVVSGSQKKVPITFTAYGDESDPGPYPIPDNAKIEGNGVGDAHVLVLEKDSCVLYEMYASKKNATGWDAASGAVWDLKSNTLRPETWTSADAAGLPILPGLVRYDEVAAGEVKHAIRFTAQNTQQAYIFPATHYAGLWNTSVPPMGLRVRMKADFDISKLTGQAKIIATAMKKYGMILADNGSRWFFQGDSDPRWNDDDLNQLKKIPGSAFEAVYTGPTHRIGGKVWDYKP